MKWEKKRLSALTSVGSGTGFPLTFQGKKTGKYPFYKVSDMNLPENAIWMVSHNNSIDELEKKSLKAVVHPSGTIIFPKIGAAIATNKKRILKKESCFDNNVIGIYPSSCFDVKYLYYYLCSLDLRIFSNSGNPPSIRKTTLEKWEVPLPPLEEQKRIAAILDAADGLRTKRREAIAELDKFLQATFLDMFGDPVTNPKGWDDNVLLGEKCDIKSGITKGRKVKSGNLKPVAYLAVANVQDKYLDLKNVKTIEATDDEVEKYSLACNDLLLTEGGDPDKLGRGTLWKDDIPICIHQNHVFRVRLITDEINPVFLNWLIGSKRGKTYFLKSAKQTTGIASINMKQIKAFPCLIPPLPLQQKFASIVEAVERQKARMRRHLAELDDLFASLQQRAFNGEL